MIVAFVGGVVAFLGGGSWSLGMGFHGRMCGWTDGHEGKMGLCLLSNGSGFAAQSMVQSSINVGGREDGRRWRHDWTDFVETWRAECRYRAAIIRIVHCRSGQVTGNGSRTQRGIARVTQASGGGWDGDLACGCAGCDGLVCILGGELGGQVRTVHCQ